MGKNISENRNCKSLQAELETKLRKDLLSNPSEENFKAAYDELTYIFFAKSTKRRIILR